MTTPFMKKIYLFLLVIFATSCQVTETLHINKDGSGTIAIDQLRDVHFMEKTTAMQHETLPRNEVFVDSTYVFEDYFKKYDYNFNKFSTTDKKIFQKFANATVRVVKNSYNKEYRTTITQHFTTANQIADLLKIEQYADDIKNNYALAAEEHYYSVNYQFEQLVFKRIVKITNQEILKTEIERIEDIEKKLLKFNPIQSYILKYSFEQQIKTVSNPNAVLGADKKSLVLEFKLSDCLKNPEITNLEVVFED
jgi:hypothetical protein